MKYGLYLVCHEYLNEVKDFLSNFFKLEKNQFSHDEWITFKLEKNSSFEVNLMKGEKFDISNSIVFELYCSNMEELEKFSKKFNININSFLATKTDKKYKYNYIELIGPNDICKVEISYCDFI